MFNNPLDAHPYILKLQSLEKQFEDRIEFHENCKPLLLQMGNDKEFIKTIIERNFNDQGFLNQIWTGYNIPFFYVHETDHYNLKIHLFPPEEHGRKNIAAHCIHHHNNYILTTNAFFGSGYETFLFDKNSKVNNTTLETNLKISKHFHQKDLNPHIVDSWEPHVVLIPEALSATILIWTPEKKRTTDSLRQNPILKYIKKPLRWLIHKLNLTHKFGIAEEKTYQFYPNGNTFKVIEEGEYFAPTKAEKGETVNSYSAQMICAFIQRMELPLQAFFKQKLDDNLLPKYYHTFIHQYINNQPIADVYHRTEINIPQKTYYKEDIIAASI